MEKIYRKKLAKGNVYLVKNLPDMRKKQPGLLNRNADVDAGSFFIKENDILIRQKE